MTQEENPLGSDLQALLDSERTYDPSAYLASRDAVWSRVEATTGLAAATTAVVATHASAKTAAVAAKSVSLLATRLTFAALGLVAGGVVGAVAHAKFAPPPPPPVPIVQVSTVYVDRPVPMQPAPDTSASVSAPAVPAPSLAIAQPAASSSSAVRVGDLAKERELIDVARSAVATKHSDTALKSLEQHSASFPRGALSEERDALWVQALANAGRLGEARARARAFHKQYPNSMLSAAVDAAISPAP